MAKNLPIGYVEERRTAGRSSTFTKYSMAHFKEEHMSQIDPTKSANYKKRNILVLVIIHIVVMEIMASDTTAGSKLMRDK